MMRSRGFFITLLLHPMLSLGKERGSWYVRESPLAVHEVYGQRRDQDSRGKGKDYEEEYDESEEYYESDDYYATEAPTFSPTRSRSTYLPSSSPTFDSGNRAPAPTNNPTESATAPQTKSPKSTDEEETAAPTRDTAAPTDPSKGISITQTPSAETDEPQERPSLSPTVATAQTPVPVDVVQPTQNPTQLSPTEPPAELSPPAPPQQEPLPPDCDPSALAALWDGLGIFFNSDDVLSDPSSYQCRAQKRVLEQEEFDDFEFAKIAKYWVLYCIYFATNQAPSESFEEERQNGAELTWIDTIGWQETDLDPCDGWYGIFCDNNGRVTEIRLQGNGLSGAFPKEIRYFASEGHYATGAGNMQRLELFNNFYLTNDPSETWITELGPNLKVLNYGSTSFQGPLPKLPPGLVEFDCSNTQHSGDIPSASFEGLNDLSLLIMDGGNFDSVIPATISDLPSLEFFHIREAGIRGDLSYMQGMPAIVEHLVDGNTGLNGAIPSFVGELTTLKSFSATDCSLVSWLGK